ncbi:MAG: DUF2249 domain-containing protein [Planctomycetota bacterium]|jgi:uncharacterized protein (DUF2249 family)
MEIDIREIPEGERLSRLLDAISDLGKKEVLTLLSEEDPAPLMDSIRSVHGDSLDLQKMRWGRKDLPWMFHVKRSLKPSAYQPEE